MPPMIGNSNVPIGSACAIGLSVTRPWRRGGSSPSRSAIRAWPHSWIATETSSTKTRMRIQRMSCAVRFMWRGLPGTMAVPGLDCKGPELARSATTRSNHGMARRLGLDEAVDLFLDHVKVERGLARHTIESYGRDL